MMVGMSISDDQLGTIADRAIHDADANDDGKISYEELQKVSLITPPPPPPLFLEYHQVSLHV